VNTEDLSSRYPLAGKISDFNWRTCLVPVNLRPGKALLHNLRQSNQCTARGNECFHKLIGAGAHFARECFTRCLVRRKRRICASATMGSVIMRLTVGMVAVN